MCSLLIFANPPSNKKVFDIIELKTNVRSFRYSLPAAMGLVVIA